MCRNEKLDQPATPWRDPIVEEVREAGYQLWLEAGEDWDRYCRRVRWRIVPGLY